MGLVGSPEVHGYHCNCVHCDFQEEGPPLMVQHDSTCTGEVISRPMSTQEDVFSTAVSEDWSFTRQLLGQLQQAALDVDAEPGENAGFHVHVMPTSNGAKRQALGAFMLWEPVLHRIAQGRFPHLRPMNRYVRAEVTYSRLADWAYDMDDSANALDHARDAIVRDEFSGREAIDWPRAIQASSEAGNMGRLLRLIEAAHVHNDRHSTMNVATEHGTVEYRLWNSTRSAWRMELFCRLSVALTDPAVAGDLLGLGGVGVNQINDFTFLDGAEVILQQVMADAGYQRLAELIERQRSYRIARNADRWPVEFCVS